MAKVYCGECKYYDSGVSDRFWDWCAKAKTRKVDVYYGQTEVRELPAEKNAHNDCPDFEAADG